MQTILIILPVLVLAFLIRWVRIIKINSDIQVEQNKRVISLLEQRDSIK